MSLEYQEIQINNYINTTDKFGLLVGYQIYLFEPLVSGLNAAIIGVLDLSDNVVDWAGTTVRDNGLTQTYMQVNASNGNPKPLLIPPGYRLSVTTINGGVGQYGMLLLGTLDEIARVAIR